MSGEDLARLYTLMRAAGTIALIAGAIVVLLVCIGAI